MGYVLYVAQQGGKHMKAKPLKGFGGAGVVEIVADNRGNTFRTIYTVQLAGTIYVLHTFQKKSKTGCETPKNEIELVKRRFMLAEQIAKEKEL
jgi:phage-related protein